jgi:alpha-N-arabinofuranosidase
MLRRRVPLARRHRRSGEARGLGQLELGRAIENNAFGTDEFFDFAEQIGADAYVSVNVGSGHDRGGVRLDRLHHRRRAHHRRPERAANGHREPWKVKYLGIGNESWGCGGNMRPQYYADELKRYARFVRSFIPDSRPRPT